MTERDESLSRAGRYWILGLCGYSLLRALLAWPLLVHYGIDPGVFLVLDVGTAYPLGLGQVRIVEGFRAADYGAVQAWAVVAAVSFMLPYAYLFLAGHGELPAYVLLGLAALVGVLGTASVLRVRQQCLAPALVPTAD